MRKIVVLFTCLVVIGSLFSGCKKEEKVDKRKLVSELVQKGDFQKAKMMLISLRSNYPNDKKLATLERACDKELSLKAYNDIWKEAEQKNTYQEWIKAMIRIQKVENMNKDMKKEWVIKAKDKTIEAGAKQLNDGKLLGLLEKLLVRYQVIDNDERLTLITKYVNEGRFPEKDWKGTLLTKFAELYDDNQKFVGFPKPEEKDAEGAKKEDKKAPAKDKKK